MLISNPKEVEITIVLAGPLAEFTTYNETVKQNNGKFIQHKK